MVNIIFIVYKSRIGNVCLKKIKKLYNTQRKTLQVSRFWSPNKFYPFLNHSIGLNLNSSIFQCLQIDG